MNIYEIDVSNLYVTTISKVYQVLTHAVDTSHLQAAITLHHIFITNYFVDEFSLYMSDTKLKIQLLYVLTLNC